MSAHRSLPELGPMFLSACDFRQTSETLGFHASFMGNFWQLLKQVWQETLQQKPQVPIFYDFNSISGMYAESHSCARYLDKDMVISTTSVV